ncbi:MAG: beta-hexosaminidase [Oscillospiraceae bacterium]|nr:beta-hexosaminidase [Oscillospiraceae bacterium]
MKRIYKCAAALLAVCLLGGCSDRVHDVPEIIIPSTAASTTTTVIELPQQTCEVYAPETEESTEQPVVLSREEEILAQMSLEEKVGQMFIGRCPENGGAEDVEKYHLGGYILFARDFKGGTPESVRADIAEYQAAAGIPMLIGVDEEGGDIVRVSKYDAFRTEPFGAPMELYGSGGIDAVTADAAEKCVLLGSLGINMNFAPVCDLPRSENDYIYDRTFGTDAEVTSDCIAAIVTEMNDNGTISVLKHFPGYGDNVDTHTGIAYDERPLSEFRELDLLPFMAGIDAGAPCVMVSHNIIMSVDSSLPASLSPAVHELLRDELDFDGVIVTDELSMGAIEDLTGSANAAVQAVKAGNDLLCVTDYASSIEAVISAVQSGEITEERIDGSVLRLLRMKAEFGILS